MQRALFHKLNYLHRTWRSINVSGARHSNHGTVSLKNLLFKFSTKLMTMIVSRSERFRGIRGTTLLSISTKNKKIQNAFRFLECIQVNNVMDRQIRTFEESNISEKSFISPVRWSIDLFLANRGKFIFSGRKELKVCVWKFESLRIVKSKAWKIKFPNLIIQELLILAIVKS